MQLGSRITAYFDINCSISLIKTLRLRVVNFLIKITGKKEENPGTVNPNLLTFP